MAEAIVGGEVLSSCRIHGVSHKCERNLFCLECIGSGGICSLCVATLLWPSVGVKPNTWKKVRIWSPSGLPNVQSSTARPKTPRIEVFLVSLEIS